MKTTKLSAVELDGLWTVACQAMAAANLGEAFRAVETLLEQAYAGNVVPDTLPLPAYTGLASSFGPEMLQSLTDRVESLNSQLSRGRA